MGVTNNNKESGSVQMQSLGRIDNGVHIVLYEIFEIFI